MNTRQVILLVSENLKSGMSSLRIKDEDVQDLKRFRMDFDSKHLCSFAVGSGEQGTFFSQSLQSPSVVPKMLHYHPSVLSMSQSRDMKVSERWLYFLCVHDGPEMAK